MLLVNGKNCHDSPAEKKIFLKIFFKKHLTIFYTGYNIILGSGAAEKQTEK